MAKAKKDDRFQEVVGSKLIIDIAKAHGKYILVPASDHRIKKVPRLSSRVFFLDYALGGGVPIGRATIVWGHKSTGKTMICLRVLGSAQQTCGNCYTMLTPNAKGKLQCACKKYREMVCAFIDVEGSWDHEWAKLHGVNPERVLLSTPEYAEQALDIIEALLRSGDVDFIIMDSIAFLAPANEIKESSGKALQAEQARVLGRGIRKLNAALNFAGNRTGRRPTVIFTNQVRMKVGLLFGNPETTSGGMAPGFFAATEIRTKGGKYEMDEVTGRPLYVDLGFKIEKNKTAPAKIEGDWRLILADTTTRKKGDIAEEEHMIDMGIKIDLIEKEGNGWVWLGEKYKSKSLLEKTMIENPEKGQELATSLMNVLLAG